MRTVVTSWFAKTLWPTKTQGAWWSPAFWWHPHLMRSNDGEPVNGAIIETKRLVLRDLRTDDLDALAALYADLRVRQYFPDGTRTRSQTLEEIEWNIDVYYGTYGYGLWAVILKDSGELVGRCGLLPWEIDGRTEVEVAYLLGTPWWGRGLATEAAGAIVEFAFATLEVDRLIAMVDPRNDASRNVATKVGMSPLRMGYVDDEGVSDVYAIERPLGTG